MLGLSIICYISFALLPSSTIAHPTTSILQRDVSTQLLEQMDLYSQYSGAIYCNNNAQNPKGTDITCSVGSCPKVQANGATIFGNFFNVGNFSTTAMIAIDPSMKTIVLTFRGAENRGALSALDDILIACAAVCASCHCHEGFYGTWTDARSEVISIVQGAQAAYLDYELVITGHSLGAIQAMFAAAEFRANGTTATLFSYGQPHIGDEAFAEFVGAQGNNYRVTHTIDPAPRMEDPSLGYRHVSPEYWIFEDRTANFSVASDQIMVIEGTNSFAGNQGTFGEDIPSHLEYFQADLAGCFI